MELTKTQRTAVETEGKNILVSAGAGTGKTRVLVERFLYLLTSGRALVTEILALTFTEKAANEMKSRIIERLADLKLESFIRDLESSYISTIHAFASRILREHPLEAGVDPDFRVLEAEESEFLKEQALEEVVELRCEKGNTVFELLHTYGENKISQGILAVFGTARREGKSLQKFFTETDTAFESCRPDSLFQQLGEEELLRQWRDFEALASWDWPRVEEFKDWFKHFSKRGRTDEKLIWKEIAENCRLFLSRKIEDFMGPWARPFEDLALAFEQAYEARKKEKGLLDFDDLEIRAIRLFKKQDRISQSLRKRYRKKFRQILVDEFQDTNYLQMELIELLASGNNLFLVGDFKQSIYAFRGAVPRLFLEKEEAFKNSGKGLRTALLENFRTAPSVLDFMNAFFNELWREEAFSFEALIPRAEEDPKAGTELLCVELKEGESLGNGRLREAELIAERILELHEEGFSYGGIAVLFQAMTEIGIYEQALKKRGIPYYALSGTGFYHQPEIRDLVSYLSFLENPLADIPLAASLRSPLFQVSDNTLFWLARYAKREEKTAPLYGGVKDFQGIPEIAAGEKEKLAFFLELGGKLLDIKDRLKIAELIDLILAETSYELTVLADPQGVRRYANLKKLGNLARHLEGREPTSLGAFLRTLKRLEVQEVKETEAQVEAEQSGKVVRLSSIHRAKGLEFPVVFVADLGRGRQSSESTPAIAEAGKGYALQVRNEITWEWEKPRKWLEIYEAASRKEKEEWKRLFYVAVTRAKRKLILSGVHREKKEEKDSFYTMSSWIDWVRGLSSHACFEHVRIYKGGKAGPGKSKAVLAEREEIRAVIAGSEATKQSDLNLSFCKTADTLRGQAVDYCLSPKGKTPSVSHFAKIKLNQIASPSARNDLMLKTEAEKIWARITQKRRIPSRSIDLPVSAYGVFERAAEEYLRIYEIGYPPSGEEKSSEIREYQSLEGMEANDFGTAMHSLLERIDFKNPQARADQYIEEIFSRFPEQAARQARELLEGFIAGPLFAQIQKARNVYRELPFVLGGRHGRIDGILDLLFQDASGVWHIVDYKTAVGDPAKVQEARYDLQVAIYAVAVYKILQATPSSGIIHFLKNQWSHTIPFDASKILKWEGRLAELQTAILHYRQSLPADSQSSGGI